MKKKEKKVLTPEERAKKIMDKKIQNVLKRGRSAPLIYIPKQKKIDNRKYDPFRDG